MSPSIIYVILWFVKKNVFPNHEGEFGWGNGYAILPPGHPFHGKHHDDIPGVVVHGGLTFSGKVSDFDWNGLDQFDENCWIIGFDTCHDGDTIEEWSRDKVIEHTKFLLNQLQ